MCSNVFTHCWDSPYTLHQLTGKIPENSGTKVTKRRRRQSYCDKSPVSHIFHQSVTFLYVTDSRDYLRSVYSSDVHADNHVHDPLKICNDQKFFINKNPSMLHCKRIEQIFLSSISCAPKHIFTTITTAVVGKGVIHVVWHTKTQTASKWINYNIPGCYLFCIHQ